MRCRNVFPALLVGICAGALALPASASSLCHENDVSERVFDDVTPPSAATKLGPTLELASEEERLLLQDGVSASELNSEAHDELILPCAMVESDQLGPWCVDAAVYLVTTSGTLLCRVSLPALDLTFSSSPDLEDRDPAQSPQRPSLQAPAGSLASALKDAERPLVVELVSSFDRSRRLPHPVYAEPPFVPG